MPGRMREVLAVVVVLFVVVSCLVAGVVSADSGEGKGPNGKEGHDTKVVEGLLPVEKLTGGVGEPLPAILPPQVLPSFPVAETSLTAGLGEDAKNPSWSPDSGTVVFQLYDSGDGDWEIYTIDVDGEGLTRLTNNDACDTRPLFTPDGRKIVFVRNFDVSGNDHAEIWMMNPDGSHQEEISPAGDTVCRGARFSLSADGEKVVFIYSDSDKYLYELDIDDGTETELASDAYPPESPKYSPDGSKILYRDSSYLLHVINSDGSGDIQLEDDYVKWFDWSPDGRKIIYTHNDDSPYGLCLINPDGTGFEYLLETDDYCAGFPDWSPQGNWITFVYGPQSDDGEDSDIRIISPDGSEQYSLTERFDRCGMYTDPTFSPDGSKIVFVREGSSEIVLLAGVSAPPLVADFTTAPAVGGAPLIVRFHDRSIGEGIDSWHWSFGDGRTSHSRNPVHTYQSEGTYTVTLTIANAGRTETITVANCVIVEDMAVPAELMVRNLHISAAHAQPRQAVQVTADVVNEGGTWGSGNVSLMINGHHEQSAGVGVSPGTAQRVSFTVYKVEPGEYQVTIGDAAGTFYVVGEGTPQPQQGGLLAGGELDTAGVIAIVVIGIILVGGVVVAILLTRRV